MLEIYKKISYAFLRHVNMHTSLSHTDTHTQSWFFRKGTTELINYRMVIVSLSSRTFHFLHSFFYLLLFYKIPLVTVRCTEYQIVKVPSRPYPTLSCLPVAFHTTAALGLFWPSCQPPPSSLIKNTSVFYSSVFDTIKCYIFSD